MFYIAFLDIKEKRMKGLYEELYSSPITYRGYSRNCILDESLSGVELPVYLLANNYCPTNRDVYLNKVQRITQPQTWGSLKGKVIHKLYSKIFENVRRDLICNEIDIRDFDTATLLNSDVESSLLGELESFIIQKKDNLVAQPKEKDIKQFLKDLTKIISEERRLLQALLSSIISKNVDVSLSSELERFFPFCTEIALSAPQLGISSVRPDFLYKSQVIGDIKTDKPKDFFELTAVAYALAYEAEELGDINFGIIFNVSLLPGRQMPIHKDTAFFVLKDKLRVKFIRQRDDKLKIVKEKRDPGVYADESYCKKCVYYTHCWRKK